MNLGRASREELIQLVSQLLDHVEALEARISELEGRQKLPTEGGKERKPPSWAKANRPDRPKKERQNRAYGFARRREEPTHRVEHATASCPDCGTLLLGGRVCRRRQIISIPRVRARVRSMWCWSALAGSAGSGGLPNRIGAPSWWVGNGWESQSSRK